MQALKVICKKCGNSHDFEFTQSVNVAESPELKDKILSGEFFTWTCVECGTKNLINYPFLYHDSDSSLMILETSANIKSEGLPEGYTGRIVRSFGDLIEKIKIFDSGLDDIIIEMCKFITLQEMNKELALKFLKLDGADSELVFAYPLDDKMELLSVGFNVYEDCAGIVKRNREMRATDLVVVDQNWIKRFFI